MKTDNNELKAIRLAKRVFEHFTRDSIEIAREIISLEQAIEAEGDNCIAAATELQNYESGDIQPPMTIEPAFIRTKELPNQRRAQQQAAAERIQYDEVPY